MGWLPTGQKSALQKAAEAEAMDKKWGDLKTEQTGQVTEAFGKARESAGQQLGAASLEADRRSKMDLARNANASGGFGGAEAKMRTQATQENVQQTGMAKAGMEADLSAQEAQAKQGISQNISQMQMDDTHFAQQFGLAEEQFAAAKHQWSLEFAENKRTNMLMAALNIKKVGLDTNAFNNIQDTLYRFFPNAPRSYKQNLEPSGGFGY